MDLPTMRRIHRERVLLVGGQRALILQVAHPKVAAGVAAHSEFPRNAMERLYRTIDLSLATVFGTPDEAERATAGIRAVHKRVRGASEEAGGYDANDPSLLLWVNATLIDTTLVVYERFVRPLQETERRRYYDETRATSSQFGIPGDLVPPTLEAFRAYRDFVLEGPDLRPTTESRRLVRDILKPPVPLVWRGPTAAVRLLTRPLLPESIRTRFGIRAGPFSRMALAAASRASRLTLPLVPAPIREFSAVRRAGHNSLA